MTPARRGRVAQAAAFAATLVLAVAAYAVVGELPGAMYATGIVLLGLLVTRRLGSSVGSDDAAGAERPRWRRKSLVIAELRAELAARGDELSALQATLDLEREAARATEERLTARVEELAQALERLRTAVEVERARVAQSLGALSGGIDQRAGELAALERELEALLAA